MRSNKHKIGKDCLARKEAVERDIAQAFLTTEIEHTIGDTLPEDQRIYSVCVVCVFLHTPLNKLSYFCCLLQVQENALRLTYRHQMVDLIPFVFAQEQESLKRKFLTNIFPL